jgi:hypothetical protein
MAQPSPKLQNLLKEFQHIASMAGYLNHSFDPPQLRLFFTLYGRLMLESAEEGINLTPRLQAWCDALSVRLREGSSSAILPPQVQISAPQTLPDGRYYLVATLNFTSKVTETSYLRVRTSALAAYQCAAVLRDRGIEAAEMLLTRLEVSPLAESVPPAEDSRSAEPSPPAVIPQPGEHSQSEGVEPAEETVSLPAP